MVAVVDTSGSMFPDAILPALGIRVAEKSSLGKRVITFSERPTWPNLEGTTGFVDTVRSLKGAEWGTNTNFHLAMELDLDAAVGKKLSPEEVNNLVIVVFSDMQINTATSTPLKTMHETVKMMFHTCFTGICVPLQGHLQCRLPKMYP